MRGEPTCEFFTNYVRVLVGLIAIAGVSVSSTAHADSGTILISVFKAGWFLGGSGGSGTLIFHGRRYPLSIGGLSAGLVFGASETHFVGTVSNIFRPSDVAGVYGAANAGAALVVGGGVTSLINEKGAILHLNGRQIGLIADLDLSGMAISLR
jgi:lipid-binding SYLF domain-containing protein